MQAQDEPDDAKKVQPRGATIPITAEGAVGIVNIRTDEALPASKIVAGTAIPDGHTIKTGEDGKAVFLLSNGTVFTVSPKSEMVLAEFTQEPFEATDEMISDLETEPSISKVKLKLNYGNLVTDVKKLNKGSAFDISSPLGSAGIRGTTVNTQAISNGDGGFTGNFGVTGGTLAFTPPNAPPGTPPTPIAENQKVEVAVSNTGQAQVQPPAPLPPAEQQQLTATAQEAVEASADTAVSEASSAAAETTQQVQAEVDNGAPAEPAPPPASDPAAEPEPAPEPTPAPETSEPDPEAEAAAQVEDKGAGVLASAEGEIEIVNNRTGETIPADQIVEGMVIPDGHSVSTGEGGEAVLVLSNGTSLSLEADTEVAIVEFSQEPFDASGDNVATLDAEPSSSSVSINLVKGGVATNVDGMHEDSNLTITTPLGTADIRDADAVLSVVETPDGGFTGSIGIVDGEVAFTPAGAPEGTPPTVVAPEQKVEVAVSNTGEVQAQAPVAMPPAEIQTVSATTQTVATTAEAADVSIEEMSVATETVTVQIRREVSSGAQAVPKVPSPAIMATTAKQVDDKGAGVLASVEGEVKIVNNRTGEEIPADQIEEGMVVPDGHSVSTGDGGEAVLVLSNGTSLSLDADTEVALVEFSQEPFEASDQNVATLDQEPSISSVSINLVKGEVVTNVENMNEDSSLTITTPLGTADIRDADAVLSVSETADGGITGSIGIADGEVNFTPADAPEGTQPTVIAPEQKVEVAVSSQGETVVQAPAALDFGELQDVVAATQGVATAAASADVSLVQMSTAAETITTQIRTEVATGAPMVAAVPLTSTPAAEVPAIPVPTPEVATDTQPPAEAAATAATTIDPSAIDPNVLSPDR